MRIPLKTTPHEIIDAYNLSTVVENQGWIYLRVEKGMYGFKESGIIANQELVKHMAPFGYHPVQHTPGLWIHDNRNTIFSLVVDDFCVHYSSMEDADHFKNEFIEKYLITVDMEETLYIGINLDWEYVNKPPHCQCQLMCTSICTYFNTFLWAARSTPKFDGC